MLAGLTGLEEKKMFGGIGFLVQGNMACGVHRDDLIIRVGSDRYPEATGQPYTKVFDMTGKPMTGWIIVLFVDHVRYTKNYWLMQDSSSKLLIYWQISEFSRKIAV
jgi:hypothetical protein